MLLAVLALAGLTATAHAERPFGGSATPLAQGSSAGYTLHHVVTSDPTKSDIVASFTPDVKAIYAWATISADGGAEERQYTVDIQFLAPDGTIVKSQWYGSDTGTITTYPEDAQQFQDANVARKQLNIAGTPNAQRTGQWTVNYAVGGKLIASDNFTLADANDLAKSDTANSGEQGLIDAGYNVIEFTDAEGKEGNIFAYTIMEPASQDLYSAETTQQIVDGLAALRQSFADAGKLYVFLRYDPRYEIAYFTDAPNVDAYLADGNFNTLASKLKVDVFDNDQGEYLGSTAKSFITKNFGGGTYQAPLNVPGKKSTGGVGTVRVVASPSNLPADGTSKSVITITVIDNRNKPLVDAEIELALSGSGMGTIRPRVTSTDENGEADAVFTAGKKEGSVTITATVKDTTGTATITLGQGGKTTTPPTNTTTNTGDNAADNAIAFMAGQGYKATKAAYLSEDHKSAAIALDLGTSYDINEIPLPIIYGMTALRSFFTDATTLAVIIPYQQNFLYLQSTAQQYDDLSSKLGAAADDSAKKTAFNDYLSAVFAQSSLVDRNGNRVSAFKDFYNKNFTGG